MVFLSNERRTIMYSFKRWWIKDDPLHDKLNNLTLKPGMQHWGFGPSYLIQMITLADLRLLYFATKTN